MSCCDCDQVLDLGCFSYCVRIDITEDPSDDWIGYLSDGIKEIKIIGDDQAVVSIAAGSYDDILQPGYTYTMKVYVNNGETRFTDGDGNDCWRFTLKPVING